MLKYTDLRFNSNHFDKNLNLHKHSQSDDDGKYRKSWEMKKKRKKERTFPVFSSVEKAGWKNGGLRTTVCSPSYEIGGDHFDASMSFYTS